ncbi:unnamed protein product, partial [Phaedon cochleariae]
MLEPHQLISPAHRNKSGTISCIPMHLNISFSAHGFFPRRLRRWGSTGSWSPIGTSDALDQSLAGGVDMRTSVVRVAEDYTKRKNVLRVSAVKPCRSEFLLQAETTEEFADWVKTLQVQVAASTEAELEPSHNKQQAVPQLVPASTTFQVQGSHLSPQLNKPKTPTSRNRSPTGQSPVSKTRKPSHMPEPTATSPKSKTWRGRMVKQLKRFNQGANSPSSPTAPEGSTFGVPIDECLPSASNPYLPRFVEVCTEIIDERGLQTIGIYRVPGNNASITALTEEVNKNYEDVPLEDPRWNDLHVVGSLLKSYFRKMPDSLITVHLYPSFIKADKIENPKERMEQLRRLVRGLPKHNYHTLKHIILHLKRVSDNCQVNKMEAKNLAIVFGPTIVRPEGETMESMVSHMTNQCKIVETLVTHADWFFPENGNEENLPVPIGLPDSNEDLDYGNNQALLLHNISKYEALKDSKEKNGALFSSIISAAQRKVKRKPNKGNALQDCKEEPVSPTNIKIFPAQSFSPTDLKECSSPDCKMREEIPTTVMDIEKKNKSSEKVPWFKYETDKDDFRRRIENFKQETEAMLQLPRKTEISVMNIDTQTMSHLSCSASNVNQNGRLSLQSKDLHHLTKTHSASNVFAHTTNRNSLNSLDNSDFSVRDNSDFSVQYSANGGDFVTNGDANRNVNVEGSGGDRIVMRVSNRRGGVVGASDAGKMDVSNGNLKKVKYETENDCLRTESLEPLNKLTNDDDSLLSTMTKLLDQKLKEDHALPFITVSEDIPFVDDSPEKPQKKSYPDKENVPQASDLYRNPSLHKFGNSKALKKIEKELED